MISIGGGEYDILCNKDNLKRNLLILGINLEETLSTLDYAHRAKNIQNRPEVWWFSIILSKYILNLC